MYGSINRIVGDGHILAKVSGQMKRYIQGASRDKDTKLNKQCLRYAHTKSIQSKN